MRLKDQVAIVTGGAKGIGRGIALKLAEEGALVLIVDVDEEGVRHTADRFRARGLQVTAAVLDVVDNVGFRQLVDGILERYGHVDILVNNAAISTDLVLESPLSITPETWRRVIDVNLNAYFLCAQAVAEPMGKQRSGKIINISSIGAYRSGTGMAHYVASKGGVNALTRSLATDLGPYNIRVNTIVPGQIKHENIAHYFDEHEELLLSGTPLGRFGTPEDVGDAVVFLACDESSFITGSELSIDGGANATSVLA